MHCMLSSTVCCVMCISVVTSDYKWIKGSILLPCANFISCLFSPLPYLRNSAKNSKSLSWQMLIKLLLCAYYILRAGDTEVNKASPWIWIIHEEKLIYFKYKDSSTSVSLLLALLITETPLSFILQTHNNDSYKAKNKVKKIQHCSDAVPGTVVGKHWDGGGPAEPLAQKLEGRL